MNLCAKQGLERMIEYIKLSEKEVIIFGAGEYGEHVLYMFMHNGIEQKVRAFCDNNESKWGEKIADISIKGYKEIKALYPKCIFVIASMYYREIEEQLTKEGEIEFYTIYPEQLEYSKEWYEIMFNGRRKAVEEWAKIKDNHEIIDNIKKVEEVLSDESSKKIFRDIVSFKETGDYSYLIRNYDRNVIQYFDKTLFKFNTQEVFIDLGAWEGDTIKNFVDVVNGKYKMIVAFEPGQEQFLVLNKMLQEKNFSHVHTYNIGAWSKEDELCFCENEDSSKISSEGKIKVKVNSIDNMFLDQPVSLIKMDIEGAEEEALLGSKNIIQKYKPKLAVCIYHKPEDIINIPLLIKQLVPEYKIYIRHHSEFHTETVCYAEV